MQAASSSTLYSMLSNARWNFLLARAFALKPNSASIWMMYARVHFGAVELEKKAVVNKALIRYCIPNNCCNAGALSNDA
jgi:hypothetical protein